MGWRIKRIPGEPCIDLRRSARRSEPVLLLLTGDRHIDSPESNWNAQRRHLLEAKERNALVLDCGDLFDAMQGPGDPRSSRRALLASRDMTDGYFPAIVEDAADKLSPYAGIIAAIGEGNHETAPRKHYGVDLLRQFAQAVYGRTGHMPHVMGWGYWVRVILEIGGTRRMIVIRVYHGSGGCGGANKTSAKARKDQAWFPDADIILSGHRHHCTQTTLAADGLDSRGRVIRREQLQLEVGSYKDGWGTGCDGWESERHLGPKIGGQWWVQLRPAGKDKRIEIDATRARVQ